MLTRTTNYAITSGLLIKLNWNDSYFTEIKRNTADRKIIMLQLTVSSVPKQVDLFPLEFFHYTCFRKVKQQVDLNSLFNNYLRRHLQSWTNHINYWTNAIAMGAKNRKSVIIQIHRSLVHKIGMIKNSISNIVWIANKVWTE